MTTIKSALQNAQNNLEKVSESATLDAELLLAYCLDKDRSFLFTWPEKKLKEDQKTCFEQLVTQRLDDYPIAYLLGTKAFWTLDFSVTPDVLIPRPETELLVDLALLKIRNQHKPKILDLGTGSGAIALALASERKDADITACDYSKEALVVAKKNAKNNQLEKQLTFIESNWFSNIKEYDFDLIVSNPPYITPDDPHLLQTIRHEPQQALVAKNEGMGDIQNIIANAQQYLKQGGWIMIEHGYNQAPQTLKLLTDNGFKDAKNYRDLANNPRLTIARL